MGDVMPEDLISVCKHLDMKGFFPCDLSACKHFRQWAAELATGRLVSLNGDLSDANVFYCISCSRFTGNDNYKGEIEGGKVPCPDTNGNA
jgi:hypothetical protein